jgi:hypothetical protein
MRCIHEVPTVFQSLVLPDRRRVRQTHLVALFHQVINQPVQLNVASITTPTNSSRYGDSPARICITSFGNAAGRQSDPPRR